MSFYIKKLTSDLALVSGSPRPQSYPAIDTYLGFDVGSFYRQSGRFRVHQPAPISDPPISISASIGACILPVVVPLRCFRHELPHPAAVTSAYTELSILTGRCFPHRRCLSCEFLHLWRSNKRTRTILWYRCRETHYYRVVQI